MATIFSKKSPSPNTNGGGIEREGDKPLRAQPFPAPKRLTARHIAWTGLRCRRGFFGKSRSSAAKLLFVKEFSRAKSRFSSGYGEAYPPLPYAKFCNYLKINAEYVRQNRPKMTKK